MLAKIRARTVSASRLGFTKIFSCPDRHILPVVTIFHNCCYLLFGFVSRFKRRDGWMIAAIPQ